MLQPEISVKLPAREAYCYPIYIGQNLLEEFTTWLEPQVISKKIVVITDELVNKLHAKKFAAALEKSGYDVLLLSFVPGEQSKSYSKLTYLLDEMLKYKCDRYSLCIAFGGGVVGDVTGFIAAIFMRGIRYIQIPTTVLSMIDSSVGGKTAINSEYGKNLIGAFNQPNAVIMDINVLDSLPREQLINGLIEAIKMFLTSDMEYFNYILDNLDDIIDKDYTKLTHVIKHAVKLKAEVVEQDEKEENLRMILNFGHTVGHAIEKLSDYKIAHGYAVALGILVEAKISVLLGLLKKNQYILIEKLMSKLNITLQQLVHFNAAEIITAMLGDKKNKAGNIYMILLDKIGSVSKSANGKVATQVSSEIIIQALSAFEL
ncbi:MAG: aroB [Burkholderiales bacterium]|nr:aroB [Burkholderiales bacterium]